jgi:hypothetical protein
VIVLVKDAGPGQEPGLYVNSKVVAWDDLAGALKHELSGRREWAVYVEGDDCLAWANIVNVIEKGLHHFPSTLKLIDLGNEL